MIFGKCDSIVGVFYVYGRLKTGRSTGESATRGFFRRG